MPLDTDMLRDFAQATFERKALDAEAKKRKQVIDELDPKIREMFVEEGVPGTKITVEARDVDAEALAIAEQCVEAEFGHIGGVAATIVALLGERGLLAESTPRYTTSLFVGSRIWAKPVPTGQDEQGNAKATDDDYARACRALEANGYGQYVQERFNITSLSSAVKEDVEAGVIKPGEPSFDGTIIVEEKFTVGTRTKKG